MGSVAPPDGWVISTGAWGTDADRSESLNVHGAYSLHLKNTAVATTLLGPWIPLNGSMFRPIWCVVYADSNGVGDDVNIDFVFYEDDRSTVDSTINLIAGPVTATSTWEYHGSHVAPGATARWARFEVAKAASAFNVYVDGCYVQHDPPNSQSFIPSPNPVPQYPGSGGWSVFTWGTVSTINEWTSGGGGTTMICQVPGLYWLNFWLYAEDPGGGASPTDCMISLAINGTGGIRPSPVMAVTDPITATDYWIGEINMPYALQPGDVVSGACIQTAAAGGLTLVNPTAIMATKITG